MVSPEPKRSVLESCFHILTERSAIIQAPMVTKITGIFLKIKLLLDSVSVFFPIMKASYPIRSIICSEIPTIAHLESVKRDIAIYMMNPIRRYFFSLRFLAKEYNTLAIRIRKNHKVLGPTKSQLNLSIPQDQVI